MIGVLFAADERSWGKYGPALDAAFAEAGLVARLSRDLPPEETDYIVYAPSAWLQDFRPYTRAKAVLNLWAGVETVVGNETLTIPLARMVEPGMTEGMVEWVTGHVLRHHLGMDAHVLGQDGIWRTDVPPLARERTVAMLGLGALGAAAARTLAALNFNVLGWSRSEKQIDGVACFAGQDTLHAVLSRAEIAVLLMPLTAESENLIDAAALAAMPQGAVILNPGRGGLIDDAALLAALDAGHLGHATLDAFREEPLPSDHPFWAHPRVTVTPHIASATRAATAAQAVAENIRRGESGQPFLNLVDRTRGY